MQLAWSLYPSVLVLPMRLPTFFSMTLPSGKYQLLTPSPSGSFFTNGGSIHWPWQTTSHSPQSQPTLVGFSFPATQPGIVQEAALL